MSHTLFQLVTTPLDPEALKAQLACPAHGALVTFEGWVRNHHEGRSVTELTYEAYPELCQPEAERILAEAKCRFGTDHIVCVHRSGELAVGDCAVWVGVSASHRAEAFAACRFVIDEIKHRLPIWKKEFYAEGEPQWVNCEGCLGAEAPPAESDGHAVTPEAYYEKQISLPEVGQAGQQKLKDSKVLVVGAGGLGVAVLPYLAGAGVGTLGICDFDVLNVGNLHRQVLYAAKDIGQSKATLAKGQIEALNPWCQVTVMAEALTRANILERLSPYDLVVDCTDNFEAKVLLNDAALLLKKPAIFASVYQWEGQLYQVNPDGEAGCLRCIWPTLPTDCASCEDTGVMGVVPGTVGLYQANAAIQHLLGLDTPLTRQLLLMDLKQFTIQSVRRQPRPDCPACGVDADPARLIQGEPVEAAWRFSLESPPDLAARPWRWVDIRELYERRQLHELPHIPMSQFMHAPPTQWAEFFPADSPTILYCAKGVRSLYWAEVLRGFGFSHIHAWTDSVYDLEAFLAASHSSRV